MKDIYAIKCPRYEEKREFQTGRKYNDETRYKEFLNSLRALGQLPLTENETEIIVNGYEK